MKKSILFGALACFAISALGIQNATAQTPDLKAEKKEISTEKMKAPTTINQEPVKQKKDDCCANKKVEKKDDCCANKKQMKCDKKDKHDGKAMKHDDKKVRKHDGKKERKQDAMKSDAATEK